MKTKMIRSLAVLLLMTFVLCFTNAYAEEDEPTTSEVKEAFINFMSIIEDAAGIEPKIVNAVDQLNEESDEAIFAKMTNKSKFIQAVNNVQESYQAIKYDSYDDVRKERMLKSTAGYAPNYPSISSSAPTNFIYLLKLISSSDGRCGGTGYDYYEAALIGAEEALALADGACSVAGCDPTGIACAAVCGASELVAYGVHLAKLPINACSAHNAAVDSGEIEAGYENGVTILNTVNGLANSIAYLRSQITTHDSNIDSDLATHDRNIDGDLAAHDSNIDGDLAAHDRNIDGDLAAHDSNIDGDLAAHDTDIKSLLARIIQNQEEIIKLLKTPAGKRPDWNKDR